MMAEDLAKPEGQLGPLIRFRWRLYQPTPNYPTKWAVLLRRSGASQPPFNITDRC